MSIEQVAPTVQGKALVARRKPLLRTSQVQQLLTIALFAVVTILLSCVVVLLVFNLYVQSTHYNQGINRALNETAVQRTNHVIILTYARAWDFAIIKTTALFLAFALVLVGALYVLRTADDRFALTVEGMSTKGSLETSSPGLVMITLGVTLVALVLYSRSLVDYTPPVPVSEPTAEVKKSPAVTGPSPVLKLEAK